MNRRRFLAGSASMAGAVAFPAPAAYRWAEQESSPRTEKTRIRRGGDIAVPGKKDDQVQQIDVRDLTEFMIRALEGELCGTFNVTGPGIPTTMAEFVYGVKGALTSEVSWTWIDDYEFLTLEPEQQSSRLALSPAREEAILEAWRARR